MGKYIKLAWRNMWRNWRRTAIALIAIVLGLVLLLTMDGMIKGSDQAVFGNAVRLYGGNIQVHAPGYMEKATRCRYCRWMTRMQWWLPPWPSRTW